MKLIFLLFFLFLSPLSLERLEIILSPDMWPDHYRKWPNFFLCVHAISLVCAASWKKKKSNLRNYRYITGDRYVNIVVLRHAKVWIWYSKEKKITNSTKKLESFFPFLFSFFFFLFSSQVNRFFREDLIIMQIKWRSAIEEKSIETILYVGTTLGNSKVDQEFFQCACSSVRELILLSAMLSIPFCFN